VVWGVGGGGEGGGGGGGVGGGGGGGGEILRQSLEEGPKIKELPRYLTKEAKKNRKKLIRESPIQKTENLKVGKNKVRVTENRGGRRQVARKAGSALYRRTD